MPWYDDWLSERADGEVCKVIHELIRFLYISHELTMGIDIEAR